MQSVLEECDYVAAGVSADPVHGLRVALRRCRSMADGLMAIDPDPDWKRMKKAGKRLFQRLGELRDIQIMMEWIEKLHPTEASVEPASVARAPSPALPQSEHYPRIEDAAATEAPNHGRDPVAHALLEIARRRQHTQKHESRAAVEEFHRNECRQCSKSLPVRAAHIRPGS